MRAALVRLLVVLLSLSATVSSAFAQSARFQKITTDVYVAVAPNEGPSPENRGFVSNLGFIVGDSGVIAIGTGASEHAAKAMLSAIRRVTRKPVVLAVNLQATPDHVLGNRVFAERRIPILAHRETERFMLHNCLTCIRNAQTAIGARRMGKAEVARPTRLIDGTERALVAGRDLDVTYFGTTFQPGSIAVLDRQSGVIFAGEIVSLDRIPDVRNAELLVWQDALRQIEVLRGLRIVPAHGPVAPARRVAETARYLSDLLQKVEAVYEQGVPMQDAAVASALPRYSDLALYEPLHARNVHFTYLKVETQDLAR